MQVPLPLLANPAAQEHVAGGGVQATVSVVLQVPPLDAGITIGWVHVFVPDTPHKEAVQLMALKSQAPKVQLTLLPQEAKVTALACVCCQVSKEYSSAALFDGIKRLKALRFVEVKHSFQAESFWLRLGGIRAPAVACSVSVDTF